MKVILLLILIKCVLMRAQKIEVGEVFLWLDGFEVFDVVDVGFAFVFKHCLNPHANP